MASSGTLDNQSAIEEILQTGVRLPTADREAAERVVTTPKFREWLASPVSCELLIHGNFQGTQYTSALSLFSAMLVRTLQEEGETGKNYVALAFFCGKHLVDSSRGGNDAGESAGGMGMLRNLVAQLLSLRSVNLESIPAQHHGQPDIHYLRSVFAALVEQLARSGMTIFCFIDGIKYYEREEYLDDMSLVLRHLLDTREKSSEAEPGNGVFKLLVTSPSPTTVVRQAFHPDDVLSLAAARPTGQGLSAERLRRQFS